MNEPHVKFTVKIGSEDVQLVWADAESMEAIAEQEWEGCVYGFSVSFPQYSSYVNCELPKRAQASTSLHEILHNISAMYDLDLSEGKVRTLEQALCQVLGNKEYAQFLTRNLASK